MVASRARYALIAEGAQIEGEVSAEELTVGGYVKGVLHANRVTVNSTAVVKGDIFHRTLMIEGSDASMKSARAIVRWSR
jgi:cytoskeletal protein CcmA (bactofilin family)